VNPKGSGAFEFRPFGTETRRGTVAAQLLASFQASRFDTNGPADH
jgi:hypothetical protein